jgi:hypothetical protein
MQRIDVYQRGFRIYSGTGNRLIPNGIKPVALYDVSVRLNAKSSCCIVQGFHTVGINIAHEVLLAGAELKHREICGTGVDEWCSVVGGHGG